MKSGAIWIQKQKLSDKQKDLIETTLDGEAIDPNRLPAFFRSVEAQLTSHFALERLHEQDIQPAKKVRREAARLKTALQRWDVAGIQAPDYLKVALSGLIDDLYLPFVGVHRDLVVCIEASVISSKRETALEAQGRLLSSIALLLDKRGPKPAPKINRDVALVQGLAFSFKDCFGRPASTYENGTFVKIVNYLDGSISRHSILRALKSLP